MLEFHGSSCLRYMLVCSLLSRKPLTLSSIRPHATPPGLDRHFEANFLKLIQAVTSGTRMTVSESNTRLDFRPGMVVGGLLEHTVPPGRCVTYCLEPLLALLPFARTATRIILRGSTQGDLDPSIDTCRVVTCRIMQLFGVDVKIRILHRGCAPNGGGAVEVTVGAVRSLSAINLVDVGRVRRVRGIAFGSGITREMPQLAATSAKAVLLEYLPDVYIHVDVEGKSQDRGYGMLLLAETTSRVALISQETVARDGEDPVAAGERAAYLLLDQVAGGGCVDSAHQMLVLLMMGLGPAEPSRVRLGPLTPGLVTLLSHLEVFFGVQASVVNDAVGDELPGTTTVTLLGCSFLNVAKKAS